MKRMQVFHSHTELLQRAYVFTHFAGEEVFLARRGCRGCLYVLVLQVGFLLFYTLFLHWQHLPVLLPATFCLPSVASHCCLFIALARLKFYASTGCVRIGFGSILSCLFVWLCVSIWCVCVCGCVSVCVWCVAVFVFCFYSPLDAYNAFWLMLPVPSTASCLLLSSSFLYSFATPLLLILRCLQSI